ncbi:MAG: alpha/beta hydrolase [Actinobacteria bacterium]|nr:MAG: alpha/beta hydrolase [Actinomycetota bacterium]
MTESIRVGELLVRVWRAAEPDAPVAIAAHGITANGLSWARVAQLLDGRVTLLAPDLRGRAGSRDAAGPYGIARHADDLAAVLDELGIPEAVLVGHSMGGYIAAVTAVRHPWKAVAAVLVDGGLSHPPPPGTDLDEALATLLGPALDRLEMTFPDHAAYREFWQRHPAFTEWSPIADEYLQADLVGTGPYRSSCVPEAVRTDGRQFLSDPEVLAAVHALPVPATLLYAERGLMNQTPGVYSESSLAELKIPYQLVPDTNHYSILLADKGAQAVADQILRYAVNRRSG